VNSRSGEERQDREEREGEEVAARFRGYRRLSHLGVEEHLIAEAIATFVFTRRGSEEEDGESECARERERKGEKRTAGTRANRIWQCRGVAYTYMYCYGYVHDVRARDSWRRAGMTERRFFLPRARSYARLSHLWRSPTTVLWERQCDVPRRYCVRSDNRRRRKPNASGVVELIYLHPRLRSRCRVVATRHLALGSFANT